MARAEVFEQDTTSSSSSDGAEERSPSPWDVLGLFGNTRSVWKPPRFLEPLTGKTATSSFSMRISCEGGQKGTGSEQCHAQAPICVHGTGCPMGATRSHDAIPGSEGCSGRRRSPPASPCHPVTAPSPLSSLPGACGAARRRCGCRQQAVPGEGRLQAPCLAPSLCPPVRPRGCALGMGPPWLLEGFWGLLDPQGSPEVSCAGG